MIEVFSFIQTAAGKKRPAFDGAPAIARVNEAQLLGTKLLCQT
jgi:hypothetical protein